MFYWAFTAENKHYASKICLSHRPGEPGYHILDLRFFVSVEFIKRRVISLDIRFIKEKFMHNVLLVTKGAA